jgi:hypothetical protein
LDFGCLLEVDILAEFILFTGALADGLSVLFFEADFAAVFIFWLVSEADLAAVDLTGLVFAVTSGFLS